MLELPNGIPVELHWRIHWYERDYAGTMLRRSTIVDGVRRPAPIDELLSLMLYVARDGFVGLRGLVDISTFWCRDGQVFDPGDLRATLAAFPELERPVAAAALCVDAVLGTGIAPLLHAQALDRWAVRAAADLRDWPALRSQGDAERQDEGGRWTAVSATRPASVPGEGSLSPPTGVRSPAARRPGVSRAVCRREGGRVFWDLVADRRC